MHYLLPYFQLLRPANIVTAIADILLGFAISGLVVTHNWFSYSIQATHLLFGLILSTIGLYGGGVVLNDYFDYELDKKERPERPLPSGKVSLKSALLLGFGMLTLGCIAAYQVNPTSLRIAALICFFVILYDSFAKHFVVLGPLTMGCCRGLNVLLGVSAVSEQVIAVWAIGLIPILYIGTITLISQGEVNGENIVSLRLAIGFYSAVLLALLGLGWLMPYQIFTALPFVLFWAWLVFPALWKACTNPTPLFIRKAVKAGVIALIVLDASLSAGFAGMGYGFTVLVLLPISIYLAKIFAVT